MALWGITALALFFGYSPPKRHTRFDHLSFWQKIGRLDLPGCGLLLVGLTLLLTGLNLGGGLYVWTSAPVLATLVVGIVLLIAFGIYEWKFTKIGILNHELFRGGKDRGRTFAILMGLMLMEGIMLYSLLLFYPVMSAKTLPLRSLIQLTRVIGLQPYLKPIRSCRLPEGSQSGLCLLSLQ